MLVTHVDVKLADKPAERVRAYCKVTIEDCFLLHDVKIVDGKKGLHVSMPSRRLTDYCPECGRKNCLEASYCNFCGEELGEFEPPQDGLPFNFFVDTAHPITPQCRDYLNGEVLKAYRSELQKVGLAIVEELPHPDEVVL